MVRLRLPQRRKMLRPVKRRSSSPRRSRKNAGPPGRNCVNALPPANQSGIGRFLNGFRYAARGVVVLVRTQLNARIHLAATIFVVGAGFFFGLSSGEWLAITAAIGLVWVAEGLNTAIEAVVDLVTPEFHPLAGRAKDIAAGAVLLAALTAAIIGTLVFYPHLAALF